MSIESDRHYLYMSMLECVIKALVPSMIPDYILNTTYVSVHVLVDFSAASEHRYIV